MADLKAPLFDSAGAAKGDVELDAEIFGIEPNIPVMHQVVTAQLAGARRGTASTKTRGERHGGGRKPWAQKGTGRARHGSIRSPQWRGGGIAHGPKPRDYSQRTPKKMKKLALVGIDVSGKELVIALERTGGRLRESTFANDAPGHRKLTKLVTKNGCRAQVCVEATGV
jgi:hypothetical protein